MEVNKKTHYIGFNRPIGTQTLEVIDAHPERFVVEVLTINNNSDLLIAQIIKYKPNVVVITNKENTIGKQRVV